MTCCALLSTKYNGDSDCDEMDIRLIYLLRWTRQKSADIPSVTNWNAVQSTMHVGGMDKKYVDILNIHRYGVKNIIIIMSIVTQKRNEKIRVKSVIKTYDFRKTVVQNIRLPSFVRLPRSRERWGRGESVTTVVGRENTRKAFRSATWWGVFTKN